MISEKHKDRSEFEHEVWRLRKDLMEVSLTQSERALAVGNTFCHTNTKSTRANYSRKGGSRMGTDVIEGPFPSRNKHTGSGTIPKIAASILAGDDDETMSFRTNSQFVGSEDYFTSPIAVPYRPHTNVKSRSTSNIDMQKSSLLNSGELVSESNNAESYLPQLDVAQQSRKQLRTSSSSRTLSANDEIGQNSQHSNKLSSRPRTRYIGSGLGLKQDEESAFSPTGSAKQVLKKIMDDFNRNN
jgi:hypothetical protein